MINVAHVKKTNEANFEEIRGFDELTVQPYCFVFQWFEKNRTILIPFQNVEYIVTDTEKE